MRGLVIIQIRWTPTPGGLPGRGDIDWGAYFATLREVGWQGPVVIEVEDKDYEGSLGDRKRSLIECRKFLRQWVP